jgi:hypothetical protein
MLVTIRDEGDHVAVTIGRLTEANHPLVTGRSVE